MDRSSRGSLATLRVRRSVIAATGIREQVVSNPGATSQERLMDPRQTNLPVCGASNVPNILRRRRFQAWDHGRDFFAGPKGGPARRRGMVAPTPMMELPRHDRRCRTQWPRSQAADAFSVGDGYFPVPGSRLLCRCPKKRKRNRISKSSDLVRRCRPPSLTGYGVSSLKSSRHSIRLLPFCHP